MKFIWELENLGGAVRRPANRTGLAHGGVLWHNCVSGNKVIEVNPMITEKAASNLPMIPRQGWRAFRTEQELEDICLNYIRYEEEKQTPILMVGLCVFCNISSKTMAAYARGDYDDAVNRFSEVLNRFKDRVEYGKTSKALLGEYQANFAKFDLMNNHGWNEKKAVEGTVQHNVKHEKDEPEKPPSAYTDQEAIQYYQEKIRASKQPVGA
jgi:hypothetical protein